jgi:hypothetical protein
MNVLVTGGTGVSRSRMAKAGIKPPGGCTVRVFEPASTADAVTRPTRRVVRPARIRAAASRHHGRHCPRIVGRVGVGLFDGRGEVLYDRSGARHRDPDIEHDAATADVDPAYLAGDR